jgi:hypothetical protein
MRSPGSASRTTPAATVCPPPRTRQGGSRGYRGCRQHGSGQARREFAQPGFRQDGALPGEDLGGKQRDVDATLRIARGNMEFEGLDAGRAPPCRVPGWRGSRMGWRAQRDVGRKRAPAAAGPVPSDTPRRTGCAGRSACRRAVRPSLARIRRGSKRPRRALFSCAASHRRRRVRCGCQSGIRTSVAHIGMNRVSLRRPPA